MRVRTMTLVVAAIAGPTSAEVVQYSGRAAFDAAFPGSVFEDMESYPAASSLGTSLSSGGATFSVDAVGDNRLFVAGFVNKQLSRAGNFTSGFADFGQGPEVLTVTFATAQRAFAFDINGSQVAGDIVVTLDTGDVISSVLDPDASAPYSQFVGFESDVGFTSLTIVNTSRLQGAAYDTFRAVEVPGPGGVAVCGMGLLLAGRRRR